MRYLQSTAPFHHSSPGRTNDSSPALIKTTLRFYEVRGKVLFSQVSVCPHFGKGWGGGVRHPADGWNGGYPHMADGGYPILPDWGGGCFPGQDGWVPPSQVRMGVPLVYKTGWGYPSLRLDGVPPPPSGLDGSIPPPPLREWETTATQQAVCLLHSRRRTFLFQNYFSDGLSICLT